MVSARRLRRELSPEESASLKLRDKRFRALYPDIATRMDAGTISTEELNRAWNQFLERDRFGALGPPVRFGEEPIEPMETGPIALRPPTERFGEREFGALGPQVRFGPEPPTREAMFGGLGPPVRFGEEPLTPAEEFGGLGPPVETIALAAQYDIPAGQFVTENQLQELAIPPEERLAPLAIPYEQYLTWEQARWLGFDVPEGSVVKMTPMVDAEPQFFIVPQPEVAARRLELEEELENALRPIFPEMFDPRTSWARGAFQYDIPTTAMVVTELQRQMATDYSGFVADLYGKVGQDEAESVLRLLGVTEEHILLTLDFKDQEVRVNTLITDVFPDFDNVEKFSQLLEEDWGLFVETIQTGGSSREKRALLEFMGYNPDQINQFFNTIRIIDAVDGVRQELVIDVPNKKAYDREGNWVGTYNVVTREFTQNPDEDLIKDVIDAFVLGGAHIYQQSKQFVVSALPNYLFRDMYNWERELYGDEWADAVNAGNKRIRDEFRRVYALNQTEYERWVAEHPELALPAFARGDIVTRLKEDPLKTILYEFASTAPFMIAVMGTTIGVSMATGNPLLGIAAGAAVATPPQAQDAHDALLAAGATEQQAGVMALPIGLLMSAIEVAGDLPYLKQVFPSIFKIFTKEITEEVAKRTMASMVKKGLVTFTMIEITEALEEVFQDAVLNAGIRTFDENQEIFEGWQETFLRTIVATAPLAVFGAGASLRRVSPSQTRGQTDAELRAMGFEQDPKTGNWYERLRDVLKEEGGFAIPGEFLPGEPEEIRLARITKETWDATPVEQRVTQAETAGLEGKVGSKAFEDLTTAEMATLSAVRPAIPTAEPGMPEAGIQPPLIPGVLAREVRPPGKGEIVQISMEDQLKLEQVRREAEEAPDDVREAYESQVEIEGLRVTLATDPVAQWRTEIEVKRKTKQPDGTYKLTAHKRKIGLDAFISIKERAFPSYFTIKQAQEIKPNINVTPYTQPGTPLYNHIPIADVLDELADKWGMTPDEVAERVMAIREEKRRIKQLEATIKTQMVEKPLASSAEMTPEEATESQQITGQPTLTPAQVEKTLDLFGRYIEEPTAVKAWELTRELRRETRTVRAEQLKARAQELIVQEGMPAEEAMNQAIGETMAGELPEATTDYLSDLTDKMRDALFNKVYRELKDEPFEMMSTATALTNALLGKSIPREPGPTGRSAFTRLQRVFGSQPKVLKAIEKVAKERKPLEDVVEGIYHEIGREPIPIDQKTADYLRGLSPDIIYKPTTFREPTPPTRFDPPVTNAFKKPPMFNFMEQSMFNRVLKEILWSPLDIGNFLRANKASLDNSFLRQSKLLASGHPIVAWQGHSTSWQSMFSQKHTEAEWDLIIKDPDYQIYEQIRLETGADPLRVPAFAGEKGTARYRFSEEFGFTGQGVQRLIPRFTAWLPYVKYSERAFSAGTNKIVWGVWKQKLEWSRRYSEKIASGEVILPEGEAFDIIQEMAAEQAMLGDMIQRANLRRFSGLAPAINAFFFAARSKIGRFLLPKHLLGFTYRDGKVGFNPRIMKEAWKDFFLLQAYMGGLMFLGSWLGLWELETDPRNAEFMSARIGNTRIDPWAGYRQFVVLYTRLVTKTGISSVTGAEYDVNPMGAVESFVVNSLSPLASILLEFWTGRNFLGQVIEYDDAKYWIEKITPFSINDVWEAAEEDWRLGVAVVIPAVYGEGVQTYTGDWVENWTKLGLPKYLENTAYGLMEPYYDTADFWTDTFRAGAFAGVDPATLTKEKGFPDYIRAIVEARIINEHLATLPTEKLVSLNADPVEGVTFTDYHQMWKDREKLVAAGDEAEYKLRELQPDGKYKVVTYKGEEAVEAFDRDERTSNAHLGNFSQREFALLNEYWAITDPKKQAEFLEKHKADIGVNPRQDWLRSHPLENAQLAVWGQAKILTKGAYTEFNSLIKSLDIPDNAIPLLTLPPETSIDTHFAYEDMVDEGTHSSVEAQLLLLKDHLAAEEAGVQSYVGWRTESGKPLTLSDESVEYLQLRVDNQDLYDALKEAMELPVKADRDAAVDAVRDTKVGDETFRDIERRVDAMGKGTREAPVPEEVVNAYVAHMRIVDETSGNSAEAKLNRYDNPDLNAYLMDEDYHGKQKAEPLDENQEYLDNYLIPRWRLDVKYRTEDAEYDAFETASERQGYLLEHEDYRLDRRRREALEMSNKVTGDRFPVDQIDKFIAYWELPVKGKRQERFLVENPEFADAMHNIAGLDIPKSEEVPVIQYDDIYDQFVDNFGRLEGLSDNESEFYIEDPEAREVARNALRFDGRGRYTEFGLAEIRRNGYGAFVPEQFIDAYVGYYKLIGEGKPANWKLDTGTDLWYDDDWFMMENIEFYKNVYMNPKHNDGVQHEKWDFTKVPTREVFNLYLTYLTLPHLKSKDDFRWNNPELDAWLVLKFDYTPIAEKKRREELTPYERFLEEWEERGKAIEESLAALRE